MMNKIYNSIQSINIRWLLIVLFFICIIINLIFLQISIGSFHIEDTSDFVNYYAPVAHNILEGRGFLAPEGKTPAIRYPPGYPLFIAGIFFISQHFNINYKIVLYIINNLLSSFVTLIIFFLAQKIWGRISGLAVCLIWATYPFHLWLIILTSTEILFMVFFYSSIYYVILGFLKNDITLKVSFFTGILIGIAMLIRPIAIGMGFFLGLIVWLFTKKQNYIHRFSLIMMILLGNLVIILPWEVWMYQKTGKVIPLCTGGTYSLRDGLTFAVESKGYRRGLNVPADVRALQEDLSRQYNRMDTLGNIGLVLGEKLQTQFFAMFKLFFIKAGRSWYGTDSQRNETIIIFVQSLYILFVLWGTWLIFKMGGKLKNLVIGVWCIICYFWMMNIISLSLLRYMVPLMGLLFLMLPPVFLKSNNRYQVQS